MKTCPICKERKQIAAFRERVGNDVLTNETCNNCRERMMPINQHQITHMLAKIGRRVFETGQFQT
jgi:hypothetical protein